METQSTNSSWFDFKTLLIIILLGVVILMKTCSGKSNPDDPNKIKIDGKTYDLVKTIHDTVKVKHDTTVYKPGKTIIHDTTIYVDVPVDIDTAEILKDYFAKNIYIDTLNLPNGLGKIMLRDTISKNLIYARRWDASIIEKSTNTTIVVKDPPTWQLYYGLSVGFDKAHIINYAGPSLLYKSKRDDIYSISAGYSSDKTVAVNGSIFWKIVLKKTKK